MRAYVINWYGPYSYENLNQNKHKNVLYLIAGKLKRDGLIYTYCGITNGTAFKRINNLSHKSWSLKSNVEYWVGVVERKNKPSRSLLETLENVIINFWKPELNERKVWLRPKNRIVIINQWLNTSGEIRINKNHIIQDLNDFIFYNGRDWIVSKKARTIENI